MKINTTEYRIKADVKETLTFAFVSDLHGCENAPVLDIIRDMRPDAVLVGGDYIHSTDIYKEGIEFLRRSAGLAKTFCCLGNHELRFKGDIRALTAETGAALLESECVEFGGVCIGGISSAAERKGAVPDTGFLQKFSLRGGYKILLCHRPEYYEKYIKNLDIDLILSGHAHGGQWRFFGHGVFAPGQGIFPKYTSGLYDGRLLVGRGIGNPRVIPRINNRPEVLCIKIGAEQ